MKREDDRISQLPDEILISIISGLAVKEAAATSLLSTRWRSLSPYIDCLRFPPFKPKINDKIQIEKTGRIRFPAHIRFMDRVLDWHKGRRLKEFRVHTYCLKGANIGKWFEFCLAKEVEIMDIRMERVTKVSAINIGGHYRLPADWGARANYSLVTLKCLKQLSLTGIDVDGGEIQLLLSKFPLLESLSIEASRTLKQASIVGHSTSKLKHLHISSFRCDNVELIIDNFVNLVSLWCDYVSYSLTLKNVPKLIEFSTGCKAARILSDIPSSIHHQLQTLKIFISNDMQSSLPDQLLTLLKLISNHRYSSTAKDDNSSLMLPELVGLKNLEIGYAIDYYDVVTAFSLVLYYLCQACPSLEKIEIKFKCLAPASQIGMKGDKSIRSLESEKKLCPNLKRMKISGFIGSPQDLEFVYQILTIVESLEELVVETCDESERIRKLATEHAWRHFQCRPFRVLVNGDNSPQD